MDVISTCPLCGNQYASVTTSPCEKGQSPDYFVECDNPFCGCRLCVLVNLNETPFEKTFSLGRWEFTLRRRGRRKYMFVNEERRAEIRKTLEKDWRLLDVRSETSDDAVYTWNHAARNRN